MSKAFSARVANGQGTVTVDGEDISTLIGGFTVDCRAGKTERVTLDVVAGVLDLDVAAANVAISEQLHALLVRLGWTPPEEAS